MNFSEGYSSVILLYNLLYNLRLNTTRMEATYVGIVEKKPSDYVGSSDGYDNESHKIVTNLYRLLRKLDMDCDEMYDYNWFFYTFRHRRKRNAT